MLRNMASRALYLPKAQICGSNTMRSMFIRNKIYLKDVNKAATEESLKKQFSEYGEIKKIQLCNNDEQKKVAVAYVEFEEDKAA